MTTAGGKSRVRPEPTGREMRGLWVLKEVGRGAMGEVLQGYDPRLDRFVAIKMMRSEIASDALSIQRFEREARAIAKLSHANIVQIYDIGEEDGSHYLVMEWVDGPTLSERLTQGGPMDRKEVMRLMREATDALDYALEQGVVHRDIKPGNIMLDSHGRCKIADFGLAKLAEHDVQLTTTGALLGSPSHMSPEACRGENTDHRSDIYSLGITMYQLLQGELPYRGATTMALLYKHINEPLPEPPALKMLEGGVWMNVILKMTAKSPFDRYQNYGELRAALTDLETTATGTRKAFTGTPSLYVPAGGGSVAAPAARPLPPPRAHAPARRFGTGAIAMAAAGVLVVGGTAYYLLADSGGPPPPPAPAAAPAPTAAAQAPPAGELRPEVPGIYDPAENPTGTAEAATIQEIIRQGGARLTQAYRNYDFRTIAEILDTEAAAGSPVSKLQGFAEVRTTAGTLRDFRSLFQQGLQSRPGVSNIAHRDHGSLTLVSFSDAGLAFTRQDGSQLQLTWNDLTPREMVQLAAAFWEPNDFRTIADHIFVLYPMARPPRGMMPQQPSGMAGGQRPGGPMMRPGAGTGQTLPAPGGQRRPPQQNPPQGALPAPGR